MLASPRRHGQDLQIKADSKTSHIHHPWVLLREIAPVNKVEEQLRTVSVTNLRHLPVHVCRHARHTYVHTHTMEKEKKNSELALG